MWSGCWIETSSSQTCFFAAIEWNSNPGLTQISYFAFKYQTKPTNNSRNDLSHLYVYKFLLRALEMFLWFASVPPKRAGGGIDTDGEKGPSSTMWLVCKKGTLVKELLLSWSPLRECAEGFWDFLFLKISCFLSFSTFFPSFLLSLPSLYLSFFLPSCLSLFLSFCSLSFSRQIRSSESGKSALMLTDFKASLTCQTEGPLLLVFWTIPER